MLPAIFKKPLDFDATSSDSIPDEEVIRMEYTIKELSRLSGVTTRALRWYDEIGLLTPSGRTEGGYRRYGPAEVDRLQDILYYRALGVELARIRACLDDPSFDRLAVLRDHLSALEAERDRVQGLIESVRETILSTERKEIMSDEKKFEALKRGALEEYRRTYETESREKYGDDKVDAMLTRLQGVTREQYQTWDSLGREILEKLSAAVAAGEDPAGEAGLAHRHRGQVRRFAPPGYCGALCPGRAVYRLLRPRGFRLRPVSPGRGMPLGPVKGRAREVSRASTNQKSTT